MRIDTVDSYAISVYSYTVPYTRYNLVDLWTARLQSSSSNFSNTPIAWVIEGRADGSADQSFRIKFTTGFPHSFSSDVVGGRLLCTATATMICIGVMSGKGPFQLSNAQSTMANE